VKVLPFLLLVSPWALAQQGTPPEAPAPRAPAEGEQGQGAQPDTPQASSSTQAPAASTEDGYTPADAAAIEPALRIMGYVDFGWAKAGGDGTSFAPNDERLPADYGVDTFAPAVNSRGDVASTTIAATRPSSRPRALATRGA